MASHAPLSPTAFIERLRLKDKPDYDWVPSVGPPLLAFERTLKVCPPPADASKKADSLDEARAIIRDAILEYLRIDMPDHMLLVKSLPGTGKTTAAVDIVDSLVLSGRRVAYAGPRHDLFQDVIAKSDITSQWYEWQPRQAEDPDSGKIQTCRYADQINTWLARGYAGMDFCAGVCKWEYVNNECAYHKQKARKEGAIYIQHQHVSLGHPLDFNVLFGDENPISAFTREWRIPAKWIVPPGMDPTEPLTEVLHWLSMVAGSTDRAVQGPELLEICGGAETVLQACELYSLPANAQSSETIHQAEEVENKPYFHLPETVNLLAREARQAIAGVDYPYRVIVSPGAMTLLTRHIPSAANLPDHIIWLDGTGQSRIYEKLFGRRVKVIDGQPRLHGRIFQVVDRANGKSSLDGENARGRSHRKQTETLVQSIIKQHGYLRPVVITYKDLAENGDFGQADTAHFYAARGTNAYEDADAVIVVGAPQANIYDVVKQAKMIFFERNTAFRVKWLPEEKVYNFIDEEGSGRSYPVSGFWEDPDLQAVLEAIREDEIIQAAHRGRPVNKPVDIWLLTNVPIWSLPPDELLTMRDILDAPEGVDIFKWEKVQRLMETQDVITISDLVKTGLHYETANQYLDLIATQPGWEKAAVKSKRGKPTKIASRSIIADGIKRVF